MDEEKSHQNVLHWLDSWRLAAAAAVTLAILLGVWSIKLTADTRNLAETNTELIAESQRQAKILAAETEARKQAEAAANRNQVETCFARNASSPGLRILLLAIKPTVAGDPRAEAAIDNYIELSRENMPSRQSCVDLAKKLDVPIPKQRPGEQQP